MNATATHRLSEYPLWRLIVMLDDAERLVGPASDSARAIAAAIRQRLIALSRRDSEADEPRGLAPCKR